MLSLDTLSIVIPIEECGEPLVPLKDSGLLLEPFWEGERNIEGDAYKKYIESHSEFGLQLRESVFKRLVKARSKLPNDWKIVVKAGFRPLSVQKSLFKDFKLYLKDKHPDWSQERIVSETRLMVSDPSLLTPPHTAGAAVDIEVRHSSGSLVDFGSRANSDGEVAHTFSAAISKTQQENRITLLEAMIDVGFANLAQEWWHFSYGDQYWAVFYDKPTALYDTVEE